jgi:hypothetical protein
MKEVEQNHQRSENALRALDTCSHERMTTCGGLLLACFGGGYKLQ